MKTIEERAEEWVDSPEAAAHPYNRRGMIDAYIAGSKAKYEELTRWRDPKESVPEHEWAVLVKITTRIYDVASYSSKIERWVIENYSLGRDEIIGWREIH